MIFSESLRKNAEFTKELQKITKIQSQKRTLVYQLLFWFYWVIAFLIHSVYNNSRTIYSSASYLVLIIALIGALIWVILSVRLRVSLLVSIAEALVFINLLWIITKTIAYTLYKLCEFVFKVGDKISEKYNNLDESDKAKVTTVAVFLVELVAGQFIKEGLLQDISTFVDPHEESR